MHFQDPYLYMCVCVFACLVAIETRPQFNPVKLLSGTRTLPKRTYPRRQEVLEQVGNSAYEQKTERKMCALSNAF